MLDQQTVTHLSGPEWRDRRRRHEERVDDLLAGHRQRSRRGIKHPVEDFLFQYYSYRPYQLRRWHPGANVVLHDAEEWLALGDYVRCGQGAPESEEPEGIVLDPAPLLRQHRKAVRQAYTLLTATADRTASFGCFGMHEWAMVDGQTAAETRHRQLGLRVSPERISATIREVGVRCTHFDAYRFFTPSSKPLNRYALTRANQVDFDQPGCLHVGMDLYKMAFRVAPLIPAELVVDCFELARAIREMDMAASPYDLSALGVEPLEVDTPEGRAVYAGRQREFAENAQLLRTALRHSLGHLAAVTDARQP